MKKGYIFKKIALCALWACIVLCLPILSSSALAADSVCAEVKLEISQELTLERQAFDAHMRITNGLTNISLQAVNIEVRFTDANGATVPASYDPHDTSALFFISLDTMENITDVTGNGTVEPVTAADIHWLIIPAQGASNGVPQGTLYYVGATLTYTIGGEEHVTEVTPDYILVKPMPNLVLDYFLTRDVYGDDAFTPEIEPSIPFTLGVRAKNTGFGTARNLKINSAQPQIFDNKQGLLIGFEITGCEVNGLVATKTLLASFGDIAPNKAATARWIMLCTLSGHFDDFTADYSHADELGGELTALMEKPITHFLVRDVLVDLPGRDTIKDFLAKDADVYRVYESETVDTVVTDQSASSTLIGSGDIYTLTTPSNPGFLYVQLTDPFGGQRQIQSVTRSDGKHIKPENCWLSKTRVKDGPWQYFINLFDGNAQSTYTISFVGGTTVPNQPPVLGAIVNQTAIEGKPLSFAVSATDPDGTTPTIAASPLPSLASFTDQGGGSGLFTWTPAVGQKGQYVVTMIASDGVLQAQRDVTIKVNTAKDIDGDGMDDEWEMRYFGTLDRDGTGDFDRDGISDLDEFLLKTDPTISNHIPTTQVIIAPLAGAEVASRQPALVIENSTDSHGDVLTYTYEVYADAGMTSLVARAADVAQGQAETTWQVPQALAEHAWYYWQVRASDGVSVSPWATGSFFVKTTNSPPGPFQISAPLDGGEVTTLTPMLEVTNSIDPDGDAVSYEFEVYADEGMTLLSAQATGVTPGPDKTAWQVTPTLADHTWYFWRVRAGDRFSYNLWVYGKFFVNTANNPPGQFQISAPLNGAAVSTQTPVLEVTNSVDPDGDAIAYTFEVYADQGMGTLVTSGGNIPAGKFGFTTWGITTPLSPNATYYWRAIATDEHGASTETALSAFMVNTQNRPPSQPAIVSPAIAEEITSLGIDLVATTVLDPDGDVVRYVFELDKANTFDTPALRASAAIPAGVDTTAWQVAGLADNTWYYWRVKASDGMAESAWTIGAFFTTTANEPPATPTLYNPGDKAWVDTPTPILAVNPAKDPDDDVVTYAFEVYADANLTALIAEGQSAVSWWTLPAPLTDISRYFWRARAIDEHDTKSGWMATARFFVKDDGVDDPPAIGIIEPTKPIVTNGVNALVTWVDGDPDSNADIALYYDTNPSGEQGTLITAGLKEDLDPAADTYTWQMTGVADGTYYVYATITDATTSVTSYGMGIITIDRRPPSMQAEVSPVPNAHGWNNSPVTVNYTVNDGLSGIDEAKSSYAADVITQEGAGISVGADAADKAGNTAAITEVINLDMTLPVITVASRTPAANSAGWNNAPVTITYAVSDALSGVDEAIGGYEDDAVSTEGKGQSVSGSVTDKAGNAASITVADINIDLTPPVVEVISPAAGSVMRAAFDLVIKATDSLSGIAQAEYQVDAGQWRPLLLADASLGRYAFTWQPLAGDEGAHTIHYRAIDKAGNVTMSAGIPITIELETPEEQITGTLAVSPTSVYQGQEVSFIYTVTNDTSTTLDTIGIRVVIVDPQSNTVKKTLDKTATIPAGSTATGNLNTTTADLAPQLYHAQLQVILAGGAAPRTLATANFVVKTTTAVTEERGDPINLLVWVNEQCDRSQGHSHEGIGKERWHHRSPRCIKIELLQAILTETVGSYLIVSDSDAFASELRNPYFTDILILGDQAPLPDHVADELRERVYAGTGLISSLWLKHGVDIGQGDEPLFGLRYKGQL
ncbi:MAG: Ig-like domain-containing protein, partial [Deltaproteobacteria bacterium]|nr:Ig-like domain-containing protein [Deltaproteobacteria bacterium]